MIGFFVVLIISAIITIIVLSNKQNKPGKQCKSDSNCGSSLVCDRAVFECRIQRGKKCKNDSECITGTKCKSKVCTKI